MVTTAGTSVTALGAPGVANQIGFGPAVQTQDGWLVGQAADASENSYLIAIDASGALRWAVSGLYQPKMATADGGVIATAEDGTPVLFDQTGTVTGQLASLPIQSWRGNTYQQGSVMQVVADQIPLALTLWAAAGANPSGSSTAARPWYFKLVWVNNCATEPWPRCGFALYPDNPNALENLAVNAESQAGKIKSAALAAFKRAFESYPVNVSEGAIDSGDHHVKVLDGQDFQHPCGRSLAWPSTVSDVFYVKSMEEAQWALPIVLTTAQQVQAALTRADLMKAIGAGIGNNAAHELAHQFLSDGYGMDDESSNTYNGGACVGDTTRWVWGFGPINWGPATATELKNRLGGGWH